MNLDELLKQTSHRKYLPPTGNWFMRQNWDELLFAHWKMSPEKVKSLLPPELEVDLFDGYAWVGVVPFVMRRVRFALTPELPYISEFLELNVRTYVRYKGEPGVFFFSLDASNALAVEGARLSYALPYFNVQMNKQNIGDWHHYSSKRIDSRGKSCALKVQYRPLDEKFSAVDEPAGLAYFLTERYRLFTYKNGHVQKAEVHHMPWPLQNAEAQFEINTMLEPIGLEPEGDPVLFYSHTLSTLEWAPARVIKELPAPLLQKSEKKPSFFHWLFGLENLMLPMTGRQLQLKSLMPSSDIFEKIEKYTPSHLVSRIKDGKFTLYPKTPFYLRPFVSKISGTTKEEPDGSLLLARVGISRWAQGIINGPIAAAASIGLGFAISSYLLPHPILLFYAFILTAFIPVISCLFSAFVCKKLMAAELPSLFEHLESVSGSSEWQDADNENWKELPRHKMLSSELIAGIVCGVIYLGIAFGLHAQAWNLWTEGKYRACAALCQPVATLAEAILGDDSATVADCKYYLAECYRCMGETKKAKELYENAVDTMGKTLGEENPFYADAIYNLGRCQESEGDLDKALSNYQKTLSIWKNSPLVGANNMVYAKGLNREAVCLLKMNRPKEARLLQEECLKIDKAYKKKAGKSVQEDLNDLSAIDIALEDYTKAKEEAQKSIERKLKNMATKLEMLPSNINLCRACLALNLEKEAEDAMREANYLLGESTVIEPNLDGLNTISQKYEQKVKTSQVLYEVPIFDTRGNVTFTGKGRL